MVQAGEASLLVAELEGILEADSAEEAGSDAVSATERDMLCAERDMLCAERDRAQVRVYA